MPQWSSLWRWPFLYTVSPSVEFPAVKLTVRAHYHLHGSWGQSLWSEGLSHLSWAEPTTSTKPRRDWTVTQQIAPWKQATDSLGLLQDCTHSQGLSWPLNKSVTKASSASLALMRATSSGKFWVGGEGQEGEQEQLPGHQRQRRGTWTFFLPVPCIAGMSATTPGPSQLRERVLPFGPDCAQGPQPGLAQNCATWSRHLPLEYSSWKAP